MPLQSIAINKYDITKVVKDDARFLREKAAYDVLHEVGIAAEVAPVLLASDQAAHSLTVSRIYAPDLQQLWPQMQESDVAAKHKAIARTLCRIYSATRGHTGELRTWHQLLQDIETTIKYSRSEMIDASFRQFTQSILLQAAAITDTAEMALLHRDFIHYNVSFTETGVKLIDWEHALFGPLEFE